MFDLGWSEMGIVLLVALLVLGPKEMPKLARDLGRWTGKARALAREFQRSLEDMAREAELDDVKKQIDEAGRELRRPQLTKRLERELDPKGELGAAFDAEGERREGERRSAKGRDAGADDGATPRAGDGRPPEAPPQTDDERRPTPASSGAGER